MSVVWRTERDVVLLEEARGVRGHVRRHDGRVRLSRERVGRVVDAGELDADGCEHGTNGESLVFLTGLCASSNYV